MWDCMKTTTRLLSQLKQEINNLNFIDYTQSAKQAYYKINVTKKEEKRFDLYCKQFILFIKMTN